MGCGKVAESLHLPAAIACDDVDVACLVDANAGRARELAHAFGVPRISTDFREVADGVDAAIVALPNHLHAPATVALLQSGIHVLVEKPMADDSAGCAAMIDAATETGRTLAVGMVRRFYASSGLVKDVLDAGSLGRVRRVRVQEGGVFAWNVASDFMFRKDAGGGVLADLGVHALDLLLDWLGPLTVTAYADDAAGGVEADCRIDLRGADGMEVVVELSRLRRMPNAYLLEGERGTLELGNGVDPTIRLRPAAGAHALEGGTLASGRADGSLVQVFVRQLEDFVRAVRTGQPPFVPGTEGARAVALVEACRARWTRLEQPWSRLPAGEPR